MTEFSLTHFVSGLIETQTPEVQLFSWEKQVTKYFGHKMASTYLAFIDLLGRDSDAENTMNIKIPG